MWIKIKETKPKHGSVFSVKMLDGTSYEVCNCVEGREFLKDLKPNANKLFIEDFIKAGEYDIGFWKGNTRTRLNIDEIDEWEFIRQM